MITMVLTEIDNDIALYYLNEKGKIVRTFYNEATSDWEELKCDSPFIWLLRDADSLENLVYRHQFLDIPIYHIEEE